MQDKSFMQVLMMTVLCTLQTGTCHFRCSEKNKTRCSSCDARRENNNLVAHGRKIHHRGVPYGGLVRHHIYDIYLDERTAHHAYIQYEVKSTPYLPIRFYHYIKMTKVEKDNQQRVKKSCLLAMIAIGVTFQKG